MAKKSTKASSALGSPYPYDDMKYRAKSALETLTRAKEIEQDRQLMKAVKSEAKAQAKALDSVCKPKAKR